MKLPSRASLLTFTSEETSIFLILLFCSISFSVMATFGGYKSFYLDLLKDDKSFPLSASQYSIFHLLAIYSPLLSLALRRLFPIFLIIQLISFMIIHSYTAHLFSTWNYLTHLMMMSFVSIGWYISKTQDKFKLFDTVDTLRALRFVIALVYWQSFVSKMIYSGLEWTEAGNVIRYYSYSFDTKIGIFLAGRSKLSETFAYLSLAIEFFAPIGFVFSRQRKYFGMLLVLFHLLIYLSFRISFWHLSIPILLLTLYSETRLREKNAEKLDFEPF